jgi:hypothetical protein
MAAIDRMRKVRSLHVPVPTERGHVDIGGQRRRAVDRARGHEILTEFNAAQISSGTAASIGAFRDWPFGLPQPGGAASRVAEPPDPHAPP